MEELKEMIIQTLDVVGVLDKIRAQLRLSVFTAVQNDENRAPPPQSRAFREVAQSQGTLAAALLIDFLECYKMKYSLNVFIPECHYTVDDTREFLSQELQLQLQPGLPALFSMLKHLDGPAPKIKIPEKPVQKLPQVGSAVEDLDDIMGERQRLQEIDRRMVTLDQGDSGFELNPSYDQSSSLYEEMEAESFETDMLNEYDYYEDVIICNE